MIKEGSFDGNQVLEKPLIDVWLQNYPLIISKFVFKRKVVQRGLRNERGATESTKWDEGKIGGEMADEGECK